MTTAQADELLQTRRLVPAPSVRAYLARTIVRHVARQVPVEIRVAEGITTPWDPSPAPGRTASRARDVGSPAHRDLPVLEIVRPAAMFERLARHPKIGIGEAYMAGDWRAGAGSDLAEVLTPFAERLTTALPPALTRLRRLVDRPIPREQRNSPTGARRNIEAHYDLSNGLFEAFLDPSLTYSSALFDRSRPLAEQSLEEAQLRKVRATLDEARVGPGTSVLEIGTGWGTLAMEAARRGAQVTTLTLSHEQAELARQRIAAAGLDDRVEVRLADYREVDGRFDAVVSVEMIEAVGEEYWPDYFRAIDARLAPGGRAVVQSILMSHDRYLATRRSYGWIQKHIFPGGLIPSLQAVEQTTETHTSLSVTEVHAFGADYAETLRRWRRAFLEQWPTVERLGFDETFRRKWEFYLAYCEAGFASGYLDVARIRLQRKAERR